MKTTHALALCLFLATFGTSVAAQPVEKRTTLEDQKSVAVTIYNGDLALVKDRRQVNLDRGENRLVFREVSARMRPETAQLRSLSGQDGLSVREQNFDFDLLTPETLLQNYVGRTVQVVKTHPTTGEETVEEAEVLAATAGTVLKIGDRIETGVPGRIVFPDLPPGLRDRPTLVLEVESPTAGPREVEVSYLTPGLQWKADYVASLAPDGESLELSGWATLTNQSGAAYRDARLQLVAGEVNRVPDERMMRKDFARPEMAMAAPAASMAEERLSDYHLYTLERPTTLEENQVKQVALLGADHVPVRRMYRLQGEEFFFQSPLRTPLPKRSVSVILELVNSEKGGLGMPLPAGTVRVYQRDASGASQFVGEDRIGHTPEGETARLTLGEAFDVVAERTQTDFQRIAGGNGEPVVVESAWRIELKNAKKEKVTVKVAEPLPGDWQVVKENLHHTKKDAHTAVWDVPVPAGGKAVLEYRVRTKF